MWLFAALACADPPADENNLLHDMRSCSELVLSDSTKAGYVRCTASPHLDDDGWVDRTSAVACTSSMRDVRTACEEPIEFSECETDAECGTAGFCAVGEYEWCVCETACTTDAECGSGAVCMCDVDSFVTHGECRPANCTTNADCASGECGVSFGGPCDGAMGLYCRTDGDECRSDSDCTRSGDICMFIDGRFTCSDEYAWACE